MIKTGTYILLIVLIASFIYAEGTSAPEASKFSQPGQTEPGYTGDISLGVPLVTIPGRGGMNFPLTLSYSPGIRVDEEASWVGLGWDLGAGVITRSVLNISDDYSGNCQINGFYPNGWLWETAGDEMDDQDIYSISAPGIGGKMILSNDKTKWSLTNWRPVEITPEYIDQEITKWTVRLEDGTTLIFGNPVKTRIKEYNQMAKIAKYPDSGGLENFDLHPKNDEACDYTYAWYLTEIRSVDYVDRGDSGPDDSDYGNWVELSYTDPVRYEYKYPRTWAHSNIYPGGAGYSDSWQWDFSGMKTYDTSDTLGIVFFYTRYIVEIEKTFLSQIDTPTHYAVLSTTPNVRWDLRDDTPGSSKILPFLDKVELWSKLGGTSSKVQIADLKYAHEVNKALELSKGSEPKEGLTPRGKLTLLEVQMKSGDGTVKIPPTKFTYASNPDYHFYAKDVWGYYNGQRTNAGIRPDWWAVIDNYNSCMSGGVNFFDFWCLNYHFAREGQDFSSNNNAGAWSLTRIDYPTGGSATYEYEVDRYNWVSNKYSDNKYYNGQFNYKQIFDTSIPSQYDPLLPFELDDYRPVEWFPDDGDDGATLTSPISLTEKLGGGIRVTSIQNNDGLGHTVTKSYTYGDGSATRDLTVYNSIFVDWKRGSGNIQDYVGYETVTSTIPGYGYTVNRYSSVKDPNAKNLRNWHTGLRHPACGSSDVCWLGWYDTYFTSNEQRRGLLNYSRTYNEQDQLIASTEAAYDFDTELVVLTDNWNELNEDQQLFFDPQINMYTSYMVKSVFVKKTSQTSTQDGMTTTQEYQYNTDGLPRKVTTIGNGENSVRWTMYAYEKYPAMKTSKHMLSQPWLQVMGDETTTFGSPPYTEYMLYSNVLGLSETTYKTGLSTNNPNAWYPWQSFAWEDKVTMNKQVDGGEMKEQSEIKSVNEYGAATRVDNIDDIPTYTYYGDNAECSNAQGDNSLKHALPTCVRQCKDSSCSSFFESKSSYGLMGNVESQIDPNGAQSKYLYDKLWRLKKTFLPGDVYEATLPCTGSAWSSCYEYVYGIEDGQGGAGLDYDPTTFDTLDLNYVHTYTRIDAGKNLEAWSYADGLGKDYVSKTLDKNSNPIVTEKEYNPIGLQTKQSEPMPIDTVPADRKKTFTEYETSPLMRPIRTYPLGELHPGGVYSSSDYVRNYRFDEDDITSIYPGNLYGASRIVDPAGVAATAVVDRLGRTVFSSVNNLVVNPGFELGLEFWNKCVFDQDLDPDNDDVTSCLVSADCHSGDRCLKAVKDAYAVKQLGPISLKPNTNYRLSFWGKQGDGPKPKVRLEFDNPIVRGDCSFECAGGQGTSDPEVLHCNTEPGSAWRQDYCIFNSGSNTNIKYVGAWSVTSGTGTHAFIDDIQITPERSSDEETLTTRTTYNDVVGLSVDISNPAGQVTNTRSDTLGRVRVTKHPDFGVRRNLKYDNNNNLLVSGDGCSESISVDNFKENPSYYACSRNIGYGYDNLNRLVCVKYGISGSDANTWTGSPSQCQSAQVKNTYDVLPADAGCPSGTSSSKGRLTKVENTYSGNYEACYYYDERGRIVDEKRSIDDSDWFDLSYGYDNAGNILSLTYPNEDQATYTYNRMNQLETVSLNGELLSTYTYQPDGLVATQTYDNKCVR